GLMPADCEKERSACAPSRAARNAPMREHAAKVSALANHQTPCCTLRYGKHFVRATEDSAPARLEAQQPCNSAKRRLDKQRSSFGQFVKACRPTSKNYRYLSTLR